MSGLVSPERTTLAQFICGGQSFKDETGSGICCCSRLKEASCGRDGCWAWFHHGRVPHNTGSVCLQSFSPTEAGQNQVHVVAVVLVEVGCHVD